MLQQHISGVPEGTFPMAGAGWLKTSGAVIELVANARRSIGFDPESAHGYLDQIAAIFADPEPADQLLEILVPAAPTPPTLSAPKGGLATWQLRRVTRHIERSLGETVFIDSLAEVVDLSAGHFCRAFKVSVGETPHAFLIRQRIRRAQTLMLTTGDTLSQIACACGLTDQAHLTRLFRRMVGETPMVWRRTFRQPA